MNKITNSSGQHHLNNHIKSSPPPTKGKFIFQTHPKSGGFLVGLESHRGTFIHHFPSSKTLGSVQFFGNSDVKHHVPHDKVLENYPEIHQYLSEAANKINYGHLEPQEDSTKISKPIKPL